MVSISIFRCQTQRLDLFTQYLKANTLPFNQSNVYVCRDELERVKYGRTDEKFKKNLYLNSLCSLSASPIYVEDGRFILDRR